MKTVSEVLTMTDGIFATIKRLNANQYSELFGDIEPSTLDMMLITTCGERYAAPLLSAYNLDICVLSILGRHYEGWKRIKAALTAEYNALSPVAAQRTTQQSRTTDGERADTLNEKISSPTFDSDEGVDTNITDQQQGMTTRLTETLTTTVTDTGMLNTSPQTLIEKEIAIRHNAFNSLVIQDVKTLICLDLY